MRHLILAFSILVLWLPSCADPKCPADYILNQGRCKRCPLGSESLGDVCVNEGGVIVASGRTDDEEDSGTSSGATNAEAGNAPVAAADGGSADVAMSSSPPPSGDSGSAMDASTNGGIDSGTGGTDANTMVGADTGAAPTIDPCQGMAGCVACSSDTQCPDPGACLVRHCNTIKSICEPSFAPAQTACGTSKCDGAGKCVGCLSDNDCGDPGECKVRYCNPSTRVCEPKNAPTTTMCPTGHCDSGVCVQCSAASECADKTCQTKSCVSGQCRYANVPAGQKGSCTTGVCTASQQCAECVGDEQCTRFDGMCTVGRCVNNACQSAPKTGSCGALKICSQGSCVDSCGNAAIDTPAGEECDPKAVGWNSWSCNSTTCKRTGYGADSYRKRCTSNCAAGEVCVTIGVFAFAALETRSVCAPACPSNGVCPVVPGYSLMGQTSANTCNGSNPCVINCGEAGQQCPPGVSCRILSSGSVCAGSFYD